MALDDNTYGTVAGVERLVGDLVSSRTFSASTVPTIIQVEAELDNVAADINRELQSAGYTVPVDQTDDPIPYAFLAAANNYGAAAIVLGMLPQVAYDPEQEENPSKNRAQGYSNRLNHALKAIREHRLDASMDQRPYSQMYCGASEDDDGNEKKAIFKRTQTDYPGARTLTES